MRRLVNGSEERGLDPADRGFQYGDGLFETIAVVDGRPRFLHWHLERLADGAKRLRMPLPEPALLRAEIAAVCPPGRGVIKLIVSRGVGPRGYRPPPDAEPTRVVAASPSPEPPESAGVTGVRVGWCRTRLGANPALAGIKHLNRLEQVLARAEWDDTEQAEGLMLDSEDRVVGATQANLFARIAGRWVTPALDRCGVAGVMRRAFLTWLEQWSGSAEVRDIARAELERAEAVALTNALIGAWAVRALGERTLAPHPDIGRFNTWLAAQ